MLDDAYKEMEKAKPELEKELSAAEALSAQYFAENDMIRAYLMVKNVVFLRRRIDFLKMGMAYAQLLSTQIRIIHDKFNCPIGLQEAMTGLLFAGDRYEEIPALRNFKRAVEERFGMSSPILNENHRALNAEVKICLTVPVLSDEDIYYLLYDIAIHYNVLHPLPTPIRDPLVEFYRKLYR